MTRQFSWSEISANCRRFMSLVFNGILYIFFCPKFDLCNAHQLDCSCINFVLMALVQAKKLAMNYSHYYYVFQQSALLCYHFFFSDSLWKKCVILAKTARCVVEANLFCSHIHHISKNTSPILLLLNFVRMQVPYSRHY